MSSYRHLVNSPDGNSELQTTIFDCTLSPSQVNDVTLYETDAYIVTPSRTLLRSMSKKEVCAEYTPGQSSQELSMHQSSSPLKYARCQPARQSTIESHNSIHHVTKKCRSLRSPDIKKVVSGLELANTDCDHDKPSRPSQKRRQTSIKFSHTDGEIKRTRLNRVSSLRDVWKNTLKRGPSVSSAGLHEGEGMLNRGNAGHTPRLTRRKSMKSIPIDERLI